MRPNLSLVRGFETLVAKFCPQMRWGCCLFTYVGFAYFGGITSTAQGANYCQFLRARNPGGRGETAYERGGDARRKF